MEKIYLDALNKIAKIIICNKQGFFTPLEWEILHIVDECIYYKLAKE